MCIDFRKDPPSQIGIVIHDNKVDAADEYKYLGTTIDNRLYIRNANSVYTVPRNSVY